MVILIELEERINWGSIFFETFKISQVRPKSSKSVNFKLTDYTSNTTHSVILRLNHPLRQSISQSVRSPASQSASQSGRQLVVSQSKPKLRLFMVVFANASITDIYATRVIDK